MGPFQARVDSKQQLGVTVSLPDQGDVLGSSSAFRVHQLRDGGIREEANQAEHQVLGIS